MELGHFSTVSNTALLSLSVLGDAVPLTLGTGSIRKDQGNNRSTLA